MNLRNVCLLTMALPMLFCMPGYATNYLTNADMESHWDNAPAMNLTYTGTGSDCRLNVDVANHRFQTIVDGSVDLNYDLSDRVNYEEQLQLISAINATGRYSASAAAWNGHNYGCDGWSPTAEYTNALNGAVNLKNGGIVPEGNPSYWAGYGQTTSGSSMFAHSGSYSLNVYDNRPDAVPGSPLGSSPESVNFSQSINGANAAWTDLIGQEVLVTGWVYAAANSWQNSGQTPGYLMRFHHGVGGGTVTDFGTTIATDQWVAFQYQFTVDASSDMLKMVLFAKPSINEVYGGNGSVYFDDMSLSVVPEPMTLGLMGIGAILLRRTRR